jgi:negative regulator of sigma E activity
VSLFHGRWHRRVSLLAAGALAAGEREATLAHVAACARCRRELAELRSVLELVAADPVRAAVPPVPASFLLTRIAARLDAAPAPRPLLAPRPAWQRALAPLAAAAAVVAALSVLRQPVPAPPDAVPAAVEVSVSAETLARLERVVVREQAARYLNDAQAVLVNVAASPQRCVRRGQRLDLEEESRRSRDLLARRALLGALDRDELALARPVLQDVERVLRDVAALDPCARPQDVLAIHRDLERRRLLMKIDLTTRELLG